MYYVLGFFLLFLACCVWALICNERTCRQRKRLIYGWPAGDRFWQYSRAFDRVSYHAHLWALMTLRDPRKLYDPLNRELF